MRHSILFLTLAILLVTCMYANETDLIPKEVLKVPYSDFNKFRAESFFVDGDSVYFCDFNNQVVDEYSISKAVFLNKFSNIFPGYSSTPIFVVKDDNIFTFTSPSLYVYNKNSRLFRKVKYVSESKRFLIDALDASNMFIVDNKVELFSRSGKSKFKVWDNGSIIDPINLKKENGYKINDLLSFTWSYKDKVEIELYDKSKKDVNIIEIPLVGEIYYLGAKNDILYFSRRERKYSNINEVRDTVILYSLLERKIVKTIEVPQIYYLPLRRNFVLSNGILYFLMSAEDGLYLFKFEETRQKNYINPFDKFKYKIDPPIKIEK